MLVNEDVAYNMISEVRVFKMQILEREDKQKWVLWTATGKLKENDFNDESSDEDKEPSSKFNILTNDFFNKADAQIVFEKKFLEKTGNKWGDREYFKEKPGKFLIQNKNKKKELLKEAFKNQKDIRDLIKDNSQKFESKLPSDVKGIVDEIFNFEGMTKQLQEMNLDVEKLPLGKLSQDKINRGHQIIKEI